MKKLLYRVGAVILSILLSFNVCIYNAVTVHAIVVEEAILFVGSIVLGYMFDKGADQVLKDIGWLPEDIKVDEDGNVIISEAQMQELMDAIKEVTQDAKGNDIYGIYIYENTARVPAHEDYDEAYAQYKGLAADNDYWFHYVSHPAGARGYWLDVIPDDCYFVGGTMSVAFYTVNQSTHTPVKLTGQRYHNGVYNSALESAPAMHTYCGAPHMAFASLQGFLKWIEDDSPYQRVPATYMGGDLVITREQLQNYGVSDNTIPDGGNGNTGNNGNNGNNGNSPDLPAKPTTEIEWLELIYYRLGDILDYLKKSEQEVS
ncbi:MAG: hypothetical protein HDR00_10495 [Lachnospiraceae bacterium]|nr:hypothetical protein [Lachnospiraceae bacterium]